MKTMSNTVGDTIKVLTDTQYRSLELPKYSKWYCEHFPGYVVRPLEGKEPNRFHRYMQRLLLGWKWTKDGT
jgi:hypothetical protein